MTFAVHKLDPDNKGTAPVKLNWYVNGLGNSTVTRIDDQDRMFGFAPDDGKWALGSEKGKVAGDYGGKTRTFEFSSGVFITQTVTIMPGEPVQMASGEYKRLLNMCLVRYKIHNRDPKRSHKVGLRVMLDTFEQADFFSLGTNDLVQYLSASARDNPRVADLHRQAAPALLRLIAKTVAVAREMGKGA